MSLDCFAYPASRPALFPQLQVIDGRIIYMESPEPPNERTERARIFLKEKYALARRILKARRAGRTFVRAEDRAHLLPLEVKALKPVPAKTGRVKTGQRRAKLTADDVRQIRASYPAQGYAAIARQFGVTKENIQTIVERKSWKSI